MSKRNNYTFNNAKYINYSNKQRTSALLLKGAIKLAFQKVKIYSAYKTYT